MIKGHHSCFDCIKIMRLQKRAEEKARNEIAKELIPLPRYLWEPKKAATNCFDCKGKFSLIKWRHNCKGCGEVLCNNGGCLIGRVLKDSNHHKVCYKCSGGDIPVRATRGAN